MSKTASEFSSKPIKVNTSNVEYSDAHITAEYKYTTTNVEEIAGELVATPAEQTFTFRTERVVPKLGVMIVGLGGNNGTTFTAGILANRNAMKWHNKEGEQEANYLGSLTQASTVRLGTSLTTGRDVFVPFNKVLPMVDPNTMVVGGWDISGLNLAEGMARAKVLDFDLQRQLAPEMEKMVPLPSIYVPDFIASNQSTRADNVLGGSPWEQVEKIRSDIREFKAANGLDKVIVLWSANTERFADLVDGLNDTADNLIEAIKRGEAEVAPSQMFAVASILEGCSYINGSPQNTFVPGVVELAARERVYIGGDDFKSGQTKFKSVMVDFLVSAGIKPCSIASYNHLGNNDGKNLSEARQFRSKEISKSTVVDDMVGSNRIMYKEDEKPDHCVVIKYVPHVGDSKRALDEYANKIFLNGSNIISTYNICEDSLLAAPLMIDLVLITELCERITLREGTKASAEAAVAAETKEEPAFQGFHTVLSLLSFLLKAPMVPPGTPVVNALFKQREAIVNVMRACVGLPADNHMNLEHRLPSAGVFAERLAGDAAVPKSVSAEQAAKLAQEVEA